MSVMTATGSDVQSGRYRWRMARGPDDILVAQRLRHRVFRGGDGIDEDDMDARCRHVLIEEAVSGRVVCVFRFLLLGDGGSIENSYSARYYDLSALSRYPGKMIELGRFCTVPDLGDADVLRVAWGGLAGVVDAEAVAFLFGCSSFAGTDAARYKDAFALLNARHTAPARWRPEARAREIVGFDGLTCDSRRSLRALRTLPSLLKSYLTMGGWVSDHAVVDRDLQTLHVFTGLEVAAIPPARARALRAGAAQVVASA